MNLKIIQASGKNQIDAAKELFLEYAESLDFEFCFQNFDKELEGLPGDYTPPEGRLYIAFNENKPSGCIALRKLKTVHVK